MGKRKPGFTLEQHDQLGLEIQTMFDRLQNISRDLKDHYPLIGESGKARRIVQKEIELFEKLKWILEGMAGRDLPELDYTDIVHLYQRGLRDDHVTNPQPIRPVQRTE